MKSRETGPMVLTEGQEWSLNGGPGLQRERGDLGTHAGSGHR